MTRAFQMIDVFGSGGFSGNPLAVIHDAEGLSPTEMLEITQWMNLSETAFLLAPTTEEADYRVRIFTLRGELPFAGHPTLGSAHAWLSRAGQFGATDLVQECGAGLVRLRRREILSFEAPPLLRSGPVDGALVEDVAAVLGIDRSQVIDSQWVDNGPGWVGFLLEDRDTVLALEPDVGRYRGLEPLDIGVIGPAGDGVDVDFEVRAFFIGARGELLEDPVTGSLNASLGQWLIGSGVAPETYLAAQGTALGRLGRVHVSRDEESVWVGGATVTHVTGEI